MNFFKKSIVIRVLLLSLFATLSLAAVMVWLGLNVQKVYLGKADQKIRDDIQVVEKSYNDRISTTRKTLSMALEFISSNQITMAALMSSDRELLKVQYLKAFEEQLGPLYGASVLQFHTTNNHTFFRFQKPDDFGDDLSAFRKSVVQANSTKQAQSGIEAGIYELA
jgi:methyl-accepting chemotaxis protein